MHGFNAGTFAGAVLLDPRMQRGMVGYIDRRDATGVDDVDNALKRLTALPDGAVKVQQEGVVSFDEGDWTDATERLAEI